MFWVVCFLFGVVLYFVVLGIAYSEWDGGSIDLRRYMVRSGAIKEWFLDGVLHREDGPAIEYPDGSKEWYVNGVRTKVEWADGGTKFWWEERDEREARREEFEHETCYPG